MKVNLRDTPLQFMAATYLAGITLAELLTTFVEPRIGLLVHCLLLQALLFHASRTDKLERRALVFSLVLAPLIRIVSLSLPLTDFPVLYWYLITSVPLFAATLLTGRALGLSWKDLGFNLRRWPLQLVIGLSGLGFGALEYFILRPKPLIPSLEWAHFWWPALILLVSTGLIEEMIFRGLLQRVAQAGLGRWGLAYVALLFAVLHIGYRSLTDLIFVLSVGLFMGWVVNRTGSLVGVTLAHALTNILLFLVMPFLVLHKFVFPNPPNYLPVLERSFLDGLILAGWLLLAAAALAILGRRRSPQSKRVLSAVLALAMLRAVRQFWPAPHLEGMLSAVEPLLLIWPFITPAIPSQIANVMMGSTLYVIVLMVGASWRLGHNDPTLASPTAVHALWMSLTAGGALVGQLLLWRQRHFPVRAALLVLASGAVLSLLGSAIGQTIGALIVLSLMLFELCLVSRAVATVGRSPASPVPQSSPLPRQDEWQKKRQFLSLHLSSIVALDAPELPAMVHMMLKALTLTLEADVAYMLLKHDVPHPGLVLISRYENAQPRGPLSPTVFSKRQMPVLFYALRRDKALIYQQREWGDNSFLDALYRALGESQPGPTIVHPFVRRGYPQGLLILGNPKSKTPFSDDATQLCQVLTKRFTAIIANAHTAGGRAEPIPHTDVQLAQGSTIALLSSTSV